MGNGHDPEVIVLSDSSSDDELVAKLNAEYSHLTQHYSQSGLRNSSTGGSSFQRLKEEIYVVSDKSSTEEEQELPDVDSDCDIPNRLYPLSPNRKSRAAASPSKQFSKRKKSISKHYSSDSSDADYPINRSPKKKKAGLNVTKGIHDTSTDEIDSDEYSPSKVEHSRSPSANRISVPEVSLDNQQPCCSKSLRPSFTFSQDKNKDYNGRTTAIDLEDDLNFDLPDDIEAVSYKPPSYSSWSQSKYSHEARDIKKLSAEEKKRKKEEDAEKRKAEREHKKVLRELKKAELLREKALKKSEQEIKNNLKPGEAVKFITIVMDHEISEKFNMLIPMLDAANMRYETKFTSIVSNSFSFKRETVQQAMGDDLQLHKVSKFNDEDQLMILVTSDEAVPMINAWIKKSSGEDYDLDDIDIMTWVNSIKTECSTKKITLLFIGIENYFKSIKKSAQQQFRERVINGGDEPKKKRIMKPKKMLPILTSLEVQSCLIELQIRTDVNYRMIKNVSDLSLLLIQYAKAIADAPFKRQKSADNGFDWYAVADSAGSVRVDKEGNGLRALWIMQLQCFNKVGIDTAKAIADKYPSPQALTKAFNSCASIEDGHALLRDMKVKMGIGPLAKYRKIGPELSKRMYRFFTSGDGEKYLSSADAV